MNGEQFLENINDIDNELIINSQNKSNKKKSKFVMIGAAAAAFVLILSAVTVSVGSKPKFTFTAPQGEVVTFRQSKIINDFNQKSADIDADFRVLDNEESDVVGIDLTDSCAFFSKDTGDVLYLEGRYNDSHIYISSGDADYRDAIIETDNDTVCEIGGTDVLTGLFVTDANSKGIKTAIFYAEFTVNGNTVYIERAGDYENAETVGSELTQQVAKIISAGIDLNKLK